MTQTIEIVILPDGQTKVATHGFVGNTCRDASKFVEEALGTRLKEELTAEFHQGCTQQATEQRQR